MAIHFYDFKNMANSRSERPVHIIISIIKFSVIAYLSEKLRLRLRFTLYCFIRAYQARLSNRDSLLSNLVVEQTVEPRVRRTACRTARGRIYILSDNMLFRRREILLRLRLVSGELPRNSRLSVEFLPHLLQSFLEVFDIDPLACGPGVLKLLDVGFDLIVVGLEPLKRLARVLVALPLVAHERDNLRKRGKDVPMSVSQSNTCTRNFK